MPITDSNRRVVLYCILDFSIYLIISSFFYPCWIARSFTAALTFGDGFWAFRLSQTDETQWRALACFWKQNSGGSPDPCNTVTSTLRDFTSIDFVHRPAFDFGVIELVLGDETIDNAVSKSSSSKGRVYVLWRSY